MKDLHPSAIISSLALVLVAQLLGQPLLASDTPSVEPPAATDDNPADPGAAVERWRQLQYLGQHNTVVADLAPAAPGWVDRRSKQASKENVARMAAGVYGFEVVSSLADGDAACVVIRAAWTDKKGPTVTITPFYLWRVKDRWTYLPNPMAVETWYQSVPDELEPAYERLATWYQQQAQQHAALLQGDAASLITQWQKEMLPKPAE